MSVQDAQTSSSSTLPIPLSSSSNEKCAICLGTPENRSYTDSCYHEFCYVCLLEWSKVKAECPLCKQHFKSIIHNVRSADKYDVYTIPEATESFGIDDAGRRFRFPTTMTVERVELLRQIRQLHFETQEMQRNRHIIMDHRDALLRQLNRLQRLRHLFDRSVERREHLTATSDFRRIVYERRLRAVPPSPTEGVRESGPRFYQQNPACMHRLMPWLNRELNVLLSGHTDRVQFLMQVLQQFLVRYPIKSSELRRCLSPFLYQYTEAFQHELDCFARSRYDMSDYDRMVQYETWRDYVARSRQPDDPPPPEIILGNSPVMDRSHSDDVDSQEENFPRFNRNLWRQQSLRFPASDIGREEELSAAPPAIDLSSTNEDNFFPRERSRDRSRRRNLRNEAVIRARLRYLNSMERSLDHRLNRTNAAISRIRSGGAGPASNSRNASFVELSSTSCSDDDSPRLGPTDRTPPYIMRTKRRHHIRGDERDNISKRMRRSTTTSNASEASTIDLDSYSILSSDGHTWSSRSRGDRLLETDSPGTSDYTSESSTIHVSDDDDDDDNLSIISSVKSSGAADTGVCSWSNDENSSDGAPPMRRSWSSPTFKRYVGDVMDGVDSSDDYGEGTSSVYPKPRLRSVVTVVRRPKMEFNSISDSESPGTETSGSSNRMDNMNSDDCEIVAEMKPKNMRTPELITLSDDEQ